MAETMHRRSFVLVSARAILALPGVALIACGSSPAGEGSGTAGTDGSTGEPGSTGAGTGAHGSTGVTGESGGSGGIDSTGAGSSSGDASSGDESSSSEGSESGSSSGGAELCEPTPEDIEGPFYREGIPIGGNLDVHGDPGMPLILRGHLLDESCQPLVNAIVEIWHATPVTPDGQPGDFNATYDDTREYRYYGQVATAKDGFYEFTTLRPGWYLNGADYRPAHVHLKVWVRGVERLTTQIYFSDDPFNAADPWFNPEMAVTPGARGLVDLQVVV